MWWKQNKWKIIAPVMIAAVLAFAFWYGGNAPGLRGWTAEEPQASQTATPESAESASPTPSEEETPAPPETEAPEETPEPPAEPEASEEPAPAPTETMDIDPSTGKDKYQTDPVPAGKPLPVEPQDAEITDQAYTCTLSISCASILDHMDWLDPEKTELVPEDGWILPPTTVTFYEGESVFNVLLRTCKQQKIHMEYSNTPAYNSAYIEGIHNLYEFDCGELSGWMYQVNGWFPNYGCSRYQLADGDTVCWVYTCDLGADVGGGYAAGG